MNIRIVSTERNESKVLLSRGCDQDKGVNSLKDIISLKTSEGSVHSHLLSSHRQSIMGVGVCGKGKITHGR